jgi:hypothetical protein
MNAELNQVLARKGTAVTRLKSLQQRRRRFAAHVLGPLIVLVTLAVLPLSASAGTVTPLVWSPYDHLRGFYRSARI